MFFKGVENTKVNDYVNRISKEKTWSNDNLVLDDHYIFDKNYYKEIKPLFKDMNENFSLNFGIIIPFDLPFDSKTYSHGKHYDPKNKCLITFIFSTIKEKRKIYAGFLEEKNCEYEVSITRCEIVFTFEKPIVEIDDNFINLKENMEIVKKSKKEEISYESFLSSTNLVFSIFKKLRNEALMYLNNIIISYSMLSKDRSVRSISLDDVEFISHFRGIDLNKWETFNWMSLNNTEKFPEEKKENISDELFAQSLGLAESFAQYEFSNYQANVINAQYEICNGNKRNAIILLVSSVETLVQSIITLYWENEENYSIEESNKRIEKVLFTKMLTTYIPKIIGGKWNKKNENTIFGKWYNTSYRIRNDIIHSGAFFTMISLDEAIINAFELNNYLVERMIMSKYKYLKKINKIPNVIIKDFKLQ